MLAKKFVGELAAAANSPRLDQRETFPGFAKPGIIILHALERARERPGRPFRPEAEIDSKERPIRARSGKGLPNLGSKQVEPFVIGEIRRNLPFVAVEEDDVYVGTMIQLAAAEFSQPKNRKLRRRGAPAAAQLGVPVLINFSQTNFRQERQFESCFFQRRDFGYLAQRYPEHLPALPESKRAEVFRGNGSAFRDCMQVSEHSAVGAGRRSRFPAGTARREFQDVGPVARHKCLKRKSGAGARLLPEGHCPIKSRSGGASPGQLPRICSRVFWTCAGLSVPAAVVWIQSEPAVICESKRSVEGASRRSN